MSREYKQEKSRRDCGVQKRGVREIDEIPPTQMSAEYLAWIVHLLILIFDRNINIAHVSFVILPLTQFRNILFSQSRNART